MEQSEIAEAETLQSRDGSLVSSGWRKPSLSLNIATKLAEEGQGIAADKVRAIIAVKKVGAHLGLKPADLMLLDTLGAFSQPQDWGQGRRAIVWPSNALLMERTGFSLSALKRHIRRLAETGLIAFCDSPNGKRWGQRDARGEIVEAYGFDLSPLAVRAPEFGQLFEHLEAERALCQRLKRQITATRRMIRAQIEIVRNDDLRQTFSGRLDCLLQNKPRPNTTSSALSGYCDELRALLEEIQQSHEHTDASSPEEEDDETLAEMGSKGTDFEPHIQTTNQLQIVEDKQSLRHAPEICSEKQTPISLDQLREGCPEYCSWANSLGRDLKSWGDLGYVSHRLRPMMGISDPAWHSACRDMGQEQASAAIAIMLEKSEAGEIGYPERYLLGMAKKARVGELRLDRSVAGRARRAQPRVGEI